MALTRKFLTALGVEAEKVDEIINAHTETVDALKEERDKYKADAEKLPGVKQKLKELEDANAGNSEYKAKYEALKADFDSYKDAETKKAEKTAKTDAYKALLVKAGISEKRIPAVLKVSNVDSIELDSEGNVKGADDLEKSIKSEWSDFIVSTSARGANTANPPANTGGNVKTKDEILAIKDASERQKAIAENHELFGF